VQQFIHSTLPQFLDALYEAGCTNWDTADVYGDSEDLLGRWWDLVLTLPFCFPWYSRAHAHKHVPRFKRTGKRNEIFVATKIGAGSPSGKIIDCSPAYVKQACHNSLKKLGVDYIDLLYAHRCAYTTS
jgi:aryl-alcohol dehydrogenase-like predicted oxidoreductase